MKLAPCYAVILALASSSAWAAAPGTPTPPSRIDTTSHPTDPIKVIEIFDTLISQHRAQEALDRFIAPNVIEHDPTVEGGNRAGLYKYMKEHGWQPNSAPNPDLRDVIDRRFASGPFVVTMHHIFRTKEDRGTVFVDVFRVVDGKIVEHWDVAQGVPATNNNPYPMW